MGIEIAKSDKFSGSLPRAHQKAIFCVKSLPFLVPKMAAGLGIRLPSISPRFYDFICPVKRVVWVSFAVQNGPGVLL